jgi:glycosyltransferase involved in cell wall biosynthesis
VAPLSPVELSVLVPAFDEGPSVVLALEEILRVLESMNISHEVILISDGSTDDTVERAEALAPRGVRVVHYEINRGKGFALRTGFATAKGDVVAYIDADLDLNPRGISALYQILQEERADIAVGSKTHPASRVSYPLFRRFQSQVFRRLVRAVFGLNVADTQTGLKVLRRGCLEFVLDHAVIEGFAFDLELLVLLNDVGFKIVEGPIELDFRFTSSTGVADVVDVLADVWRIYRRRQKLTVRGVFTAAHATLVNLTEEIDIRPDPGGVAPDGRPGRDRAGE